MATTKRSDLRSGKATNPYERESGNSNECRLSVASRIKVKFYLLQMGAVSRSMTTRFPLNKINEFVRLPWLWGYKRWRHYQNATEKRKVKDEEKWACYSECSRKLTSIKKSSQDMHTKMSLFGWLRTRYVIVQESKARGIRCITE